MAVSPRPAAPLAPAPPTNAASVLLADVVSYGYAAVVVWATLQFDLSFELWQGIALMVMFVGLRWVANEMRRDLRRTQVQHARRTAELRLQSPVRWSVEQRDGLGRRVDVGA